MDRIWSPTKVNRSFTHVCAAMRRCKRYTTVKQKHAMASPFFHPAGYILGSAQIRLEYGGEVWVISGDCKTEADQTCTPFEAVFCDYFITEATFLACRSITGSRRAMFYQWWRQNVNEGQASILFCYVLGKVQRVRAGVDATIGPILTHGATGRINRAYRGIGIALPKTIYASAASKAEISER
jgi:putative mRNA 3-end processing factor